MPILPTLQKALGDAAAFLHAERLAQDTLVLTPGLVSGSAMLNAVCPPSGYAAEQLTVLAGCTQMLDLVHLAGESVVPADAAPELRLAANPDRPRYRCSGRAFVRHGAPCGNFCVKSL